MVTRMIIGVFLSFALSQSAPMPTQYFSELWPALEQKSNSTFRTFENEAGLHKARAERLKSASSLSYKPTVIGSYNQVLEGEHQLVNELTWQNQQWSTSVALGFNGEDIKSRRLNVSYTLLSNLNQQLSWIDSNRTIAQSKATLQREATLFIALKTLVSSRLQILLLNKELEMRKSVVDTCQSYLNHLQKSVQLGSLAPVAVQSLELFLQDNTLRIQALEMEQNYLKEETARNLRIPQELVEKMPVLGLLKNLNHQIDQADYLWKLDSISTQAQKINFRELDHKSWKFQIGASTAISDYQSEKDYTNSLFLNFTTSFHGTTPLNLKELKHHPRKEHRTQGSIDKVKEYVKMSEAYAQKTHASIENILQRIRLGENGIIYEITQNLNLLLGQELMLNNLWARHFRSELENFYSLKQLPSKLQPGVN